MFIKRIIIIVLIAASIVGGLNYVVDPLQIYKKAYTFDISLYEEQRFQIPGFINSYLYDSIVVGTSMTENFLPKDIKDILSLDSVKLSISGASGFEQRLVIEKAIKEKKVKTILWGIDFSSYRGEVKRTGLDKDVFPFYLYDQNPLNDFKYLLNDKTTKRSITAMVKYLKNGAKNEYMNIDYYGYWQPYHSFGKEIMLKEAKKFRENNLLDASEYSTEQMKKSVIYNILKLIDKYENIEFILFYTPASLEREKYFYEIGLLEKEIEFRKYLSKEILKYSNASIYDFQVAKEIVSNFDYYKDMSHYSVEVNRVILEYIKKEKYKITKENYEEINNKFKKLSFDYIERGD